MDPLGGLSIALRAIAANKLRSALTMLGIIIGVAAVVSLMSIIRGAQAEITSMVQSMGSNVLTVMPGRVEEGMAGMMESGTPGALTSTLTLEDAEAIASTRHVPAATMVVPVLESFVRLAAGDKSINSVIEATAPGLDELMDWHVVDGEFINQHHLDSRARVCVLGSSSAKDLFGDQRPVGQWLRINDLRFRVIGLLETKGSMMGMDMDDMVIVPITTAKERLFPQRTVRGERVVSSISVQVADESQLDAAAEQIRQLLRQRHRITGDDDFSVLNQAEVLGMVEQIMGIFAVVLVGIAAISLVVGGIGIMNVMLVSVTERTREIGIRKAVGARYRHILTQFLIESSVLSLSGGVIGLGLAWLGARLMAQFNLGFTPVVSLDAVVLAFSASVVVGLFFGSYPAARAARLNPIDALRYE